MHKIIAREYLVEDEGFEPFPYRCTEGKLTLGHGFNLEVTPIPYDVSVFWLDKEINKIDVKLDEKLLFYEKLTDNRKAVLIDMVFNLGLKGLLNFKKTLQFIEEKKYIKASIEMLDSKWAEQVLNRAEKLSDIMREG